MQRWGFTGKIAPQKTNIYIYIYMYIHIEAEIGAPGKGDFELGIYHFSGSMLVFGGVITLTIAS